MKAFIFSLTVLSLSGLAIGQDCYEYQSDLQDIQTRRSDFVSQKMSNPEIGRVQGKLSEIRSLELTLKTLELDMIDNKGKEEKKLAKITDQEARQAAGERKLADNIRENKKELIEIQTKQAKIQFKIDETKSRLAGSGDKVDLERRLVQLNRELSDPRLTAELARFDNQVRKQERILKMCEALMAAQAPTCPPVQTGTGY